MTRAGITGAALAVVTLLASCGGGDPQPDPTPPPPTLSDCDTSGVDDSGAAAAESGAGGLMEAEPADSPEGVNGWTIRYCSTGREGDIIEVTGLLATPAGDPPEGGWPLVAWAHGTAGLGDQCAPSGDGIERIIYIEPWIAAGYAVVASDYEGLGTDGTPAYLVGESEARSILDSVRAARNLPAANVGSPTMTVGYSQGGHAALWTGELAPTYAPEIDLVAVVSLSGPTDLVGLVEVRADERNAYDAAAELIASWSDYYGTDPSDVVTPEGAAVLDIVRGECAGRTEDAVGPLEDFLQTPLEESPDWLALLEANSTGQTRIEAPVFIAQAQRDNLVPAEVTREALPELCATNEQLRYQEYATTHGGLRLAVAPDMLQFLADGLAGQPSSVGLDCSTALE